VTPRPSTTPHRHETASGAGGSPPPPPKSFDRSAQVGAETILAVDGKVRAAADETELGVVITNELRRLVAARQTMLLRAVSPGRFAVMSISSIATVDREAPFVRWLEALCGRLVSECGDRRGLSFELPAFAAADDPETRTYPFTYFIWQPLQLPSGETFAAVVSTRETPWTEAEQKLVEREAQVFAHAWRALHGARAMGLRHRAWHRRPMVWAALAALVALIPVPMTTLAPVEIVAAEPQRVTAPLDGVIKDIHVEPNRPVKAGETILTFDQTTLRNKLQLSEQEVSLAGARLDRARQGAFIDEKARHELSLARAELDLKAAERDYAADLLSRSRIAAERDGILIYADKDRWIGRPVKTGERIMQIVDPAAVSARVELPVSDAIVLERGSRVRIFLDADPLAAVPGRIVSEGFMAEPNATQQLVYQLHVALDRADGPLRIGSRGTAQVLGPRVPLVFYLLRRPISSLRQQVGL
jgi:multidrug resistance efflux pump